MFYDIYCELCEAKGLTPSGAAAIIQFNRATVTTWKNTGNAPKGELLTKIAKYFEVPVDFLLQRPPFEHWAEINKDRRAFLAAAGVDKDTLKVIWGIDVLNPYGVPVKDFISFINIMILSASPDDAGEWQIKMQPGYSTKAPTSAQAGKDAVSDADIKFALFGSAEIDDEVLDEVKRFAKFAIEQKEQRKQSD